jgi:alpha-tubulin suppressor-like RCC1 family protein
MLYRGEYRKPIDVLSRFSPFIDNNREREKEERNKRISGLPFTLTGGSAKAISLGQHHTCAIMTRGGLKCWGYNDYGQLGIGSSGTRYSPVDVSLGGNLSNTLLLYPAPFSLQPWVR